jgi:hypothetical protein
VPGILNSDFKSRAKENPFELQASSNVLLFFSEKQAE